MFLFFDSKIDTKRQQDMKHLFHCIFLICVLGCSDNSHNSRNSGSFYTDIKDIGEKQFGLRIVNAARQGMGYVSTAHPPSNYRNYTITLINDTIIPIQLEIGFSKDSLRSKSNSKIFLLPRYLTPKARDMDYGMSKELIKFLDFEIDKPEHLSKVLNPAGKCVLTFGVLTPLKYADPTTPFDTKLLASKRDESTINLELKINDTLIIPCGQFSYIKQ